MIGLEVGYRLIPLVDRNQGGQLMGRIKGVRKKLSQELGFLVHPVHIRDNLDLPPNVYRISLQGVPLGQAEVFTDRELAINPGEVYGTLQGIDAKDPAFGLDAVWIEPEMREQAQTMGFTVVDGSTVIATHLSALLTEHAHELLGHEEVQHLLDVLAQQAPKVVEGLVPKALPLGVVVKVLQNLLLENIPIRNMRTIAETLAEHASVSQDPATLTAAVRVALKRSIIQNISGLADDLPVITIDPSLEQLLLQSTQGGADGTLGLEPGLAQRLKDSVGQMVENQDMAGRPAVLVVPPQLRPWLARWLRTTAKSLHVLSYNEIPDTKSIAVIGTIGDGTKR
jgi:flagellar biosynthesis protein FlhA